MLGSLLGLSNVYGSSSSGYGSLSSGHVLHGSLSARRIEDDFVEDHDCGHAEINFIVTSLTICVQ